MNKPNDNPADPFKKALAEATQCHGGRWPNSPWPIPSIHRACRNDTARLPQVSRRMTRDEVLLARGTADAYALRTRFHNESIHNRYMPNGQDGPRHLRGHGHRPLRSSGRTRHARNRRQHRRRN